MKATSSSIKITCLKWALLVSLVSLSSIVFSQTSTWNGTSWSSLAPSDTTSNYTFVISAGTNFDFSSDAFTPIMKEVIIERDATCNINEDIICEDLLIDGNCSNNFMFFNNHLKNITITANGTFTNNNIIITSSNSTCTINKNFNNNNLFSTDKMIINSGGSLNNISSIIIKYSFLIGGSFTKATTNSSYSFFSANQSGAKNIKLELFNSKNINISDIGYKQSNRWVDSLVLRENSGLNIDTSFNANTLLLRKGSLVLNKAFRSAVQCKADSSNSVIGTKLYTANKHITINSGITTFGTNIATDTLNILNGSTFSSKSGTLSSLTVKQVINSIDGNLLLPSVSLTYAPTSLSLIGDSSAIAYINKPSMTVNLLSSKWTITNSTLRQVTVNSGTKGYISNSSTNYKIQRVDVNSLLTIFSMPKCDTISVSGTGSVTIKGDTRVNRLLDIAAGGNVVSKGNLTMRDSSNLYFTANGQIDSIKWQRKYGSTGWILVGVPFRHLKRTMIAVPGQTIYMNSFLESKASPRWVGVSNTDTLSIGKGYDLYMTPIVNDTLTFAGQPKIQTVVVPGMLYTPSNGVFDYQRGYNLVANPYTAPISINGFFADNPHLNKIYLLDNLGGSKGLYFVRTKDEITTPDIGSVTDKNKAKITASYLAPNQGFFIKLDSANYSTTQAITFNPSSITRNLNNNFLKSAPVYLRLYAKNASGTLNDIVLQFNDAATANINPDFDYSKFLSDSYPLEIYSIKKGSKFSIQSVKLDTIVRVPFGLIVKNNGLHSLWVNNFDALPSEFEIFIYDKVANRAVNLRDSAFSVNLSAGTYDTRFEIVFREKFANGNSQPIILSVNENQRSANIKVWSQNGHIYLDFPKEERNLSIQVIDLNGRILYQEKSSSTQGIIQVGSNFILNRIYLVKIGGDNLLQKTKLFLE